MHHCDAHNLHPRPLPAPPPNGADGAGDGGLPAPLRQGRHPVVR